MLLIPMLLLISLVECGDAAKRTKKSKSQRVIEPPADITREQTATTDLYTAIKENDVAKYVRSSLVSV